MRSDFEKWFKTTEIYESFIRYWNEEQIFRTDEDGEYLDSTVNSHLKTWQHQQSKADELQKRVDAALARADQTCIGNAMFHKQFDDVLRILRGEQALKGGEANG